MHAMYFREEWKQWQAFNSCQHSNGRFSRRWKPPLCLLTAQPDGGGHGQRQLLLLISIMVIDKIICRRTAICYPASVLRHTPKRRYCSAFSLNAGHCWYFYSCIISKTCMWAATNQHYLSNLSIVTQLLLKLGTPWKIDCHRIVKLLCRHII